MDFPPFVTPHCHPSSLDTASTIKAFVEREKELGTGAVTVTDHGTLAGCQAAYELAKKEGLTPILGLEGYFRDDDCDILASIGVKKQYPRDKEGNERMVDERGRDLATVAHYMKYQHFTVHALDQEAYKTTIRLLSRARVERHGSEIKPLFTWAMMEELGAANVTLGSGCLIGMVQRHLLQHQDVDTARRYYQRMRALVRPGNFLVEVFPHVCSHNWVQGVFLRVQEDGGEPMPLKFWAGKTLRTNVGEVKADELAREFKRQGCKHTHLLAVRDYRTWTERTPARLIGVEHVEEFLQNECTPWAPGGDVQLGANRFVLELAREHGDRVLVSDDSHYARPDDKVVQDVRLAQSGSWRFYGLYHRQSSADAWPYFRDALGVPEAEFRGWIDNSRAWAERFKGFKLEAKPSLPTKFYEVLYPTVGARNSLEYTVHLIKQHGRMDWSNQAMVARLTEEIQLLHRNGVIDLLPYWFPVEEVCRYYRDRGRLTGPGRGSAAGVLLSYLLGITHVDPLRYGLSLARFITPDRIKSGKMPDIDEDLNSRDLLVGEDEKGGWLRERFGDHYAQISTVMTLKLRSAVLDVARFTLGAVPRQIAELAHKFEMPPQGLEDIKFALGYEDGGSWQKGSIETDPALMEYAAGWPQQWEVVKKCLGLGRGLSRHACAFVLANEPVGDFIPLTEISGVRCTQFTAPAVEAAGGLKYDFLVINSLNDIQGAIQLVQQRSGLEVPAGGVTIDNKWVPALRLVPVRGDWRDVWDLPPAREVFADVATGRTETVFQFNTPGARQWLKHFGYRKSNGTYAVDRLEDMAAFTALDRPGPLDVFVRNPDSASEAKHNMLVEYARRARGAAPSPDVFQVFDRLFPETHGVMCYQEQLQKLYQDVTGCSGAEAEEFRGNVAKKKKEKILEAYPKFMAGATAKLGSAESAQQIWDFVGSWAAYGFNLSHAICYCVIAYACAYLKHHHPLEWWCSILQNAKKEEINEVFWRHCGHLIDLPDVTRPCASFEIQSDRIQAPLSLLHGVGDAAHRELQELAPIASVRELVDKVEARKDAGTKIIQATKKVKQKDAAGKVETEVACEKAVRGRSAVHSGIAYKLIVSGAMDKLFPEGTTALEMLEAYERAVWEHENELRAAHKPKPRKPKKAPEPVKPEYVGLNQYTRFQLRKAILAAYSEPILQMMVERRCEDILRSPDGRTFFRWLKPVPFATAADLEQIEGYDSIPDRGLRVAIAAYVEDVREFRYTPKRDHEAVDLTVSVDGARMGFVRWPDRDTGLLDQRTKDLLAAGLKGALVVLVLSKFRSGKRFSIDEVRVVQPPLPEKKKEGAESEQSKPE